jgi:serine protease Do
MRLFAWVTLAPLWLPMQFGFADELRTASATVYKIGVHLVNGRSAVGSAVLVAPGRLATSCHTTRDAVEILVLHQEGQLAARPDKADFKHDVCLLAVPELRGQGAARLASSDLKVGQAVTALGYGAGYRLSVGAGEVIALYRYDAGNVVRTSAFFPRGASGGGLFDERGHLVGILTFRASIDQELNYAVPTEWVGRLLDGDAGPEPTAPATPAFWEDEAADPPIFLRAAWLEYAQAWSELEALAVDWALNETDNAEAWLALGRSKLGLDRGREAVLALRRAASLDPDNSRAWYWLASAYRGIGLHEEFAQASTRLARIDGRLARRLSTPPSDSPE